jgi:hypothetical protein
MAQTAVIAVRPWASAIESAPMAQPSRPNTYARLRPMRSPTLLMRSRSGASAPREEPGRSRLLISAVE